MPPARLPEQEPRIPVTCGHPRASPLVYVGTRAMGTQILKEGHVRKHVVYLRVESHTR
ncbi:hypothetical protein CORC01_11859 [Colletotrichum orchidophilum]|uniref:Uncharacterized protein n=1 Tax=Colletotrichum orchidophilum TaxID=1209926 RepID=A0A1G4AUU7_9PEZI|nr:uncharacterized protein CORC01_11859 [Colletotrichum orchidophilum]OHE92853.1 hypothetical protein CORC01_11859 [Colletotrichum orchidophilum]